MPVRSIALSAFAVLLILVCGGLGLAVATQGWQAQPKYALDLEGGTQVILKARSNTGEPISSEQMNQARNIIAQRVNAMGVAETEISVQGGTNIMVSVPGSIDQKTSDALRRTATLAFRPVLIQGAPNATASDGGGSDGTSEIDQAKAQAASDGGGAQAAPKATGSDAGGASDAGGGASPTVVNGKPAWSLEQITPEVEKQWTSLDCTDAEVRRNHDVNSAPKSAVVACAPDGSAKYILGPETADGTSITDAKAAPQENSTYYQVSMNFDKAGGKAFGDMTTALFNGEGATGQFAIVLDSLVISAPQVQAPTYGGASITGNFSADSAQELADQLKFGALPLEFTVESEQEISATLGGDQLQKGLIAGLIGLVLVVVYAFFQYRVLAIVTTLSLLTMGMLAYGIITIMSNMSEIGFRLSLAGVAGLIVSIAFTADSFIVYFERVRDEIRDGRGIRAAVDHGWDRAKRTILASDAVNLIAAVVLYLVSAGSVRGFAFTLGLTTVLDLVVVFLFTHPILQTLVRTNFFGKGHPMSGLDPAQLGRNVPAYAGRGRFRSPDERKGRRSRRGGDDAPTETLAERKVRLEREMEDDA
ncbi:protein translocase subunit SecD [Helcobacillus massiliensis]|uniref:protein translocase subunit SecD n=1 Tax=Helcobacillus massiliensis TaxID=521392 RepID=UPI0025572B12|nr:protein translocase subunit SecD [Helcobacillus massiliensis]MDK7742845.1 protein translocase subunit SecD [Helcobacillus massiliensis]WOO94075.1 protein translocase subunit SecD [Helcobacillus massiliensis]